MVQLHSLIMAKEASLCLLFLSSILISSSGALVGFSHHVRGDTPTPAGTKYLEVAQFSKRVSKYLEAKTPISKRIAALYAQVHPSEIEIRSKRRSLDDTNTVYPTNPTPMITPPDTPTIITVPSSTNPVTISPTNPAAMPVNVPSTTTPSVPLPPPTNPAIPSTTTPSVPLPPPTNPANSPPAVPVTNPATTPTPPTTVPVTNPVTSYPPPSGNVPVTNPQPPPSNTNGPSTQGQSWCVAKTGAPQASLQSALDYACGMGGADCSQIQQGGSCYSPVTLQNHASFAFNSYYQKNPSPTSCDFGGAATLVNTNPSSGSCIFPSSASSSSSSSMPMTPSPTPPTSQSTPTTPPPSPKTLSPSIPTTSPPSIPTAPPTTPSGTGSGTSGYGTPPSVLNSSNPASGTMPDFGSESPPVVNTTSASRTLPLKPFTACIVLMISFVTVRLSSMSP